MSASHLRCTGYFVCGVNVDGRDSVGRSGSHGLRNRRVVIDDLCPERRACPPSAQGMLGLSAIAMDDVERGVTVSWPLAAWHRVGAVPLHVAFAGGDVGAWRVERLQAVVGPLLSTVSRLDLQEGQRALAVKGTWVLRGVTSSARYTKPK